MSAFERMMSGAHISDVEILADASAAMAAGAGGGDTTHSQQVARNRDFTEADDVHFAVSNNAGLPTNLAPNAATILQTAPSTPYKPRAMTIPSDQCIGLYIQQVEYGPFRFIDGGPVPASAHSEVSLNQFIQWPTIQTSAAVKITLYNDTNNTKRLSVDFRGTRVR
jgi:hypothetical protein